MKHELCRNSCNEFYIFIFGLLNTLHFDLVNLGSSNFSSHKRGTWPQWHTVYTGVHKWTCGIDQFLRFSWSHTGFTEYPHRGRQQLIQVGTLQSHSREYWCLISSSHVHIKLPATGTVTWGRYTAVPLLGSSIVYTSIINGWLYCPNF